MFIINHLYIMTQQAPQGPSENVEANVAANTEIQAWASAETAEELNTVDKELWKGVIEIEEWENQVTVKLEDGTPITTIEIWNENPQTQITAEDAQDLQTQIDAGNMEVKVTKITTAQWQEMIAVTFTWERSMITDGAEAEENTTDTNESNEDTQWKRIQMDTTGRREQMAAAA